MWDSGTTGKHSSPDHSPLSPRSSPAGRLRDLSRDRDSSRGLPATGRHKRWDRNAPSNVLPVKPALSPRQARPEQVLGHFMCCPRCWRARARAGQALQAEDGSRAPACQRSPLHRRRRNGSRETKTRRGQRREGGAMAMKAAGNPLRPSGTALATLPSPLVWSWPGRTPTDMTCPADVKETMLKQMLEPTSQQRINVK